MPQLNVPNPLPDQLTWYTLARMLLLFPIVTLPFSITGNWLSVLWSLSLMFGLPLWLYVVLSNKFVSYTVNENMITINSGIVFKRSVSIPFDQIQNVDNTRGPLSTIFGLSKIKV